MRRPSIFSTMRTVTKIEAFEHTVDGIAHFTAQAGSGVIRVHGLSDWKNAVATFNAHRLRLRASAGHAPELDAISPADLSALIVWKLVKIRCQCITKRGLGIGEFLHDSGI